MKTRFALVGVYLLLGVCAAAAAFENEPDGFRGIKWGSDFSQHKNEMTLIESGKETNFYMRKGDKMSIGGASLSKIVYAYQLERLHSVMIETEGVENKSALIAAFKSQFGTGEKPNRFIDEYRWAGPIAFVHIKCNSIRNSCRASLSSVEMLRADRERSKKQAEGAKKDF
jgi:hypothetical protein